ncbi:MAG: hypothetical protein NT169_06510 [Chloroflexi bacterium]|nr:hypothetical protein [Chloroflexota bacterium]
MMTIKEWAAEYRLINETEWEDRRQRLPQEPVGQSVRAYFDLARLAQTLSGSADEPAELWPSRMAYYRELVGRWQRLAERQGHARQP